MLVMYFETLRTLCAAHFFYILTNHPCNFRFIYCFKGFKKMLKQLFI